MEECLELKVKRGEMAKEFPLLKIAKAGDVGLDVAVVLPYNSIAAAEINRYKSVYGKAGVLPSEEVIEVMRKYSEHEIVVINPGERRLLPTDIKVELPAGYWASIEARSSTSKKSLIVPKGIIDEGYRGELFAQIINVGTEPVTINHGDRLIQIILHERVLDKFTITEVDELSESERGESGFGSSGQSVYTSNGR